MAREREDLVAHDRLRHHRRRREPGGIPPLNAVAIDLGASSVRYAHGRLVDGKIEFETVRQVANESNGRCWDLDHLVSFCREAVGYAKGHGATVGIDSWGVDHAFVSPDGKVVEGPVMYRDPSHLAKFEAMAPLRHQLFQWTGIAHQPFNTLYQLAARLDEDPSLPERAEWFVMPDLIGFLLTGVRAHEQTQASTTQLMGLDGRWSQDAFDLVGWPVPSTEPQRCGGVLGHCDGVPIVSVASHDTGSAVLGIGPLDEGDAYLNVGTWALLGTVLDKPCTSAAAEEGNWTNEWAHDGTVRFLKNIPGFYVVTRLHDELGVAEPMSEWLDGRDRSFQGRFDQQDSSLYNPVSMPDAVAAACSVKPQTSTEWAQAALASLVDCIVADLPRLEKATGRPVRRIRVAGGGSRSDAFCQAFADASGRETVAGPVEATVLGNLAMQFASSAHLDPGDLASLVSASIPLKQFQPEG